MDIYVNVPLEILIEQFAKSAKKSCAFTEFMITNLQGFANFFFVEIMQNLHGYIT